MVTPRIHRMVPLRDQTTWCDATARANMLRINEMSYGAARGTHRCFREVAPCTSGEDPMASKKTGNWKVPSKGAATSRGGDRAADRPPEVLLLIRFARLRRGLAGFQWSSHRRTVCSQLNGTGPA
jgi:hypothetical protein